MRFNSYFEENMIYDNGNQVNSLSDSSGNKSRYWIGSAITAGAGLITGLFSNHANKKAQQSANAANLQIARETNAANYRQQELANKGNIDVMREQNAFNENMWNLQNSYNSPIAQRQRYEAAGINPYFAMSNIQNGNADSLLSASSAPMQAATAQTGAPMQPVVDRSSEAVFNAVQMGLSESQAESQAIDNMFKPVILANEVAKGSQDLTTKKLNNKMVRDTFNDVVAMRKAERQQAELRVVTQDLQNQSIAQENEIRKYFKDNIQPAQLAQINESINQMAAQIALMEKQKEYTQKEIDNYEKNLHIKFMSAYGSLLSGQAATVSAAAAKENADTQRMIAPSVINSNNANAYQATTAGDYNKQKTWNDRQSFNWFQSTLKDRVRDIHWSSISTQIGAFQGGYNLITSPMRDIRENAKAGAAVLGALF